MSDYSWIGPLVGGIAKGANSYGAAGKANSEVQGAYDEMLRALRERFGDYDALGKAGYKDITAQQVGPTALEGIPEDLQSRQAQQEAIAALEELAANGGLSLADMQALNEIQSNLNRNASARRQGTANEFAARGQLGSGAMLAMDLAGQQQAAESANQRGESVAAQAQQRALQAVLEKGRAARSMGNDDYARKAEAAKARDAIEARNAAARTDAAKSNNAIAGQGFDDEMRKLGGKNALTSQMNDIAFGRGTQSARTTAAQASAVNNGIDNGVAAWGSMSNSASDNSNDYGKRGDASDITTDEDEK